MKYSLIILVVLFLFECGNKNGRSDSKVDTTLLQLERRGDSTFVNGKFDHTISQDKTGYISDSFMKLSDIPTVTVDTTTISLRSICGHSRDSLFPCITFDTTTGKFYRKKKHK